MTLLTTIAAFAVTIGILITFHELGHYLVADSVQFLESKSAAASNANSNAYVPDYDQGSNQGYQSDNSSSQSYSNDFTSSDTLDIASDDLPF